MDKNDNVIVTGAGGFVGTALCKELLARGKSVTAVVREGVTNIHGVKQEDNLHVVGCDMDNYANLKDILNNRNYDVMYHLAWEGTSGKLRGDLNVQLDNIRNSTNILYACKELGCRRFVFASSIMEYEIQAIMNTDTTPSINSLYSCAKLSAGYMLRIIAASMGIDYIRAVVSNIYGPGEFSPRLVNSTIRKMLNGERCSFSKGTQMYDFIYISDAVKAFLAIGDKGLPNKTYYIGSLQPRPLKTFLTEIRDIIDADIDIGFGEVPSSGISLSYNEFDINAVKIDTGFAPEISFSEGIKRTAKWIKETGECRK